MDVAYKVALPLPAPWSSLASFVHVAHPTPMFTRNGQRRVGDILFYIPKVRDDGHLTSHWQSLSRRKCWKRLLPSLTRHSLYSLHRRPLACINRPPARSPNPSRSHTDHLPTTHPPPAPRPSPLPPTRLSSRSSVLLTTKYSQLTASYSGSLLAPPIRSRHQSRSRLVRWAARS